MARSVALKRPQTGQRWLSSAARNLGVRAPGGRGPPRGRSGGVEGVPEGLGEVPDEADALGGHAPAPLTSTKRQHRGPWEPISWTPR